MIQQTWLITLWEIWMMSNTSYVPADIRITNLVSSLKELDIDLKDSRIQKEVQQIVLNILSSTTSPTIVWLTAVERAEQLGYKFEHNKQKFMLGEFLTRRTNREGLNWRRPDDGSYNTLYSLTKQFDSAITDFFLTYNPNE